MAVDLGSLISGVKEAITFDELSDKRIAIDAYNTIYQFLSIIRQPDGTPLTDSKNNVTSHLSGLFYRTINLLEHRITPIYVFDGIPSHLKRRTIEARIRRRQEAAEEWKKAQEKGMLEEARMHAMASSRITKEIINSSKELLSYMGIPYIQAPGEGEAEAAHLTRSGLVYASGSQDYDLFLFGSDVVIRNLTISGKRKLPRRNVYVNIELNRIVLRNLLENLGIDREQLIMLGMLVGTDFNEGIDKIGPKTALKIVKERKTIVEVENYIKEKYGKTFEIDPREVMDVFENPEVVSYQEEEFQKVLTEPKPNKESILEFMCDKHEFAEERINKFADKLIEMKEGPKQKGIEKWL